VLDTQFLPTPFTCSWTNDGDDAAWIRLAGELDIATSARLERTLFHAQRQARLVVADLRQVAFVDTSGIHVLVDATRRARRLGRRLVILRGPPHIDRIFALTEMRNAVEIVDLDAAAPPIMALLQLAADEQGTGSADVDDRLQATG
jgi:anti-sigma B factor antagonist